MTITIEKGIEIPPRGSEHIDRWRKILPQLQIKDSFVVSDCAERHRVLTAAKRCNVKVTTRKLGPEGYRVWRVQ